MSIFEEKFASFQKEAFRLETLPEYRVSGEWEDYQSYLQGEVAPTYAWTDWQENLSTWKKESKRVIRLRVVDQKLTPYIHYEMTRYYEPHSLAGEQIFFMLKPDFERNFGTIPNDFWLFDQESSIDMKYGPEGEYIDSVHTTDSQTVNTYITINQTFQDDAFSLKEMIMRIRCQSIDISEKVS